MVEASAPQTPEELFNRAFALHQANQIEAARKLYDQVLEQAPEHVLGIHSLGVIALAERRHRDAIILFGRAIALKGDEAVFHSNLARAVQGDGRLHDAIPSLRKAIELNPEFVGAWQALAEIYYALDNTDEAARAIRKVAELQTKTAEAYNQQGIALVKANRLKEAAEVFRAGISCKPNGSGIYYNAGNVLTAIGQYSDAILCLTQASKLEPKATQVYVSLSNAHYRKGDLSAALAARSQAWRIDPNITEERFEVSASPVVAPLRKINAPKPTPRAANERSGTVTLTVTQAIQQGIQRHGTGDLTSAEALYRKVLAADAENADALHLYGVLMHQRGMHRGALDMIDRAIAKNNTSASFYSNRALVLAALGEFEGAEHNCQRALELDPHHKEARENVNFVQRKKQEQAVVRQVNIEALPIDGKKKVAGSETS
jgi:tetratricopeptide (TPR) repeat protein